jgi:hypothetical protein
MRLLDIPPAIICGASPDVIVEDGRLRRFFGVRLTVDLREGRDIRPQLDSRGSFVGSA